MKLKTPTAVILVVVLLGLSFAVIFWSRTPSGTGRDLCYYYDLNTSKLFVDEIKLQPPIPAPSGPLPDGSPAGVRAYVYSYGDCDDPEQCFVGFLEGSNLGIRAVDGEEWVSSLGSKADDIRKKATASRPGMGKPKKCYPTKR